MSTPLHLLGPSSSRSHGHILNHISDSSLTSSPAHVQAKGQLRALHFTAQSSSLISCYFQDKTQSLHLAHTSPLAFSLFHSLCSLLAHWQVPPSSGALHMLLLNHLPCGLAPSYLYFRSHCNITSSESFPEPPSKMESPLTLSYRAL